jgi:hypothetical protein
MQPRQLRAGPLDSARGVAGDGRLSLRRSRPKLIGWESPGRVRWPSRRFVPKGSSGNTPKAPAICAWRGSAGTHHPGGVSDRGDRGAVGPQAHPPPLFALVLHVVRPRQTRPPTAILDPAAAPHTHVETKGRPPKRAPFSQSTQRPAPGPAGHAALGRLYRKRSRVLEVPKLDLMSGPSSDYGVVPQSM